MCEWRDIEGYEGLYQVSENGRIRSLKYYGGSRVVEMKLSMRRDGYITVGLSKNNVAKTYVVHRLVAKAFIPNPQNLEMINHKDEDRANNKVENLEWCTRSYNQLYSLNTHPGRNNVFGKNFIDKKTGKNTSSFTKKGIAHTNKEKVGQYSLEGELIEIFDNSAIAGKILNINSTYIYGVCKRNANKDKKRRRNYKSRYHGYIWEFVE